MKKSVTVLAGLLLFASGWAFGKSRTFSADGTSWETLGSMGKVAYVWGFRSGFIRAELDLETTGFGKGASPQHLSPALKKYQAETASRARAEDWPLIGFWKYQQTNGQVLTTMEKFYSDYRNVPVCWSDALMFSAASLDGHPATEQELDSVRESDATNKCGYVGGP